MLHKGWMMDLMMFFRTLLNVLVLLFTNCLVFCAPFFWCSVNFRSRREPSSKLADLFDNEPSGGAAVSKSVSFKYKSGQSTQKPMEAQTNGTASNSSSQRNVIYQETVQLYN